MKKLIITLSIMVITNIMYSQNSAENVVNETTYQFDDKSFCISIGNICDMTSKELAAMQVQKEDMMGNLWKYKFLNTFNMYHNPMYSPIESVFIDFTNVNGVTKNGIIELLDKCEHLIKTEVGYTYKNKNVKVQQVGENGVHLLHFLYQF